MKLSDIIELNALAQDSAGRYSKKRSLFSLLTSQSGTRFCGISGPRGVGKTVLLKQLAAENKNAFYLSLDTIQRDEDLFEIIKKLNADYGYKQFFLDEVHFYPAINAILKKVYDFLDTHITFTSSVALAMTQSAYDLSRRVRLFHLLPFSFREYLWFKKNIQLAPLSLEQIFEKKWSMEHMRCGTDFEEYFQGGLMPFALSEPDPLPLLENILDTVIMKDIPTIAGIRVDELDLLQKTVRFTGASKVDGINYTTLAKNLGITKYKAEQYIGWFEKAFILQRVFPKGTNVLQEPKVLMRLPYRRLFCDPERALGGCREDFFIEMMQQSETSVAYLKSTRGAKTPDFLINDDSSQNTVIEIGGKGKGREQFKGIHADRKIILSHSDATDGIKRPLFMLGYLT